MLFAVLLQNSTYMKRIFVYFCKSLKDQYDKKIQRMKSHLFEKYLDLIYFANTERKLDRIYLQNLLHIEVLIQKSTTRHLLGFNRSRGLA